MRSFILGFGLMLALLASQNKLAGQDKDKDKPADTPKEESVVAHDSKTHGALQVKSVSERTSDWFDVLQNGKRAFSGNPPLLNSTLELAPGTYEVSVNRTQRKVTIEAGKKTILLTGELIVEGQPASAYWYPMQGKERRVTSNPPILNRSLALFAGNYTVFVNAGVAVKVKDLGEAKVVAGQKTVLKH